jgi:hypothetical protein
MSAAPASLSAACALLRRAGLDAAASVAGHARDVLVVHARVADLARVRAVSAELKTLGFRYVTIDLAADA